MKWVLALTMCASASAAPLEFTSLSIPGGYEVHTPAEAPFSNVLNADFTLTVTGGYPGGQINAEFSFAADLQADCQDNGYLSAIANGKEVYYFDSCRQPPHIGGLLVTFGVPLNVSLTMVAAAWPGPHSFPNAYLSGSLRLSGFFVAPDLNGPGGEPLAIQFAPASVPEPLMFTPMLTALWWFGRRRKITKRISKCSARVTPLAFPTSTSCAS
ncbi:MAG: hypothetical protein ABJF23_20520 [Bryobacteraceae bacterium]